MQDKEARVVLKTGKQKELIEIAKEKTNYTWKKLSLKLGIGENYLKNEVRKEQRTINKKTFDILCKITSRNFDKFIVEFKDKNWGRCLGGKNSISKPKKPEPLISETSVELAELFGILLGDGNLCEIPEKGIYQVRIFGHKINDYEYLTTYVKNLFKKLFNLEVSIYTRKKCKVVILSKQSKNLLYTLKSFGLESGNKVLNAKVPKWIMDNKRYMRAFVRGLIDTDGCIYPKTRKHKTPTIWFYSASPAIRTAINKAFKTLNYSFSVWTKTSGRCMHCSIGNSKDVLKYYQEIGFSNPKHEKRFQKFCIAPIV